MWDGLVRLRELPNDTLVYCGHEYAQSNAALRSPFDPNNAALRIRAGEVDRLPSAEPANCPCQPRARKAANPFLRADHPTLARAMKLPRMPMHMWCSRRFAAQKTQFKPA